MMRNLSDVYDVPEEKRTRAGARVRFG